MAKKRKRKNNSKIQDYYNDGVLELVRCDNVITMRNLLTEAQNDVLIKQMGEKHTEIARSITNCIEELKTLITKQNPLMLLKFCQQFFLISNIGITSEHQLDSDQIHTSRLTEYVQSVLVSCESLYQDTGEDSSEIYFRIQELTESLYMLVHEYLISWAFYQKQEKTWDGQIDLLLESLLFFNVRGNRYQVIEESYFKLLLESHDNEIRSIYDISSKDVVNGLMNLLYALSQGQMDPINTIGKSFESESPDCSVIKKEIMKLFGHDSNDVEKITNWPKQLIKDLSYECGESTLFFRKEQEYAGWPIQYLPIQRRPFITVDGKYYCFDYYSLSDNFYRAFQRAIVSHGSADSWNKSQKDASEQAVAKLFRKLLPESEVFIDNYYPVNNSKKRMAENDLLIVYYDICIVVEVKSGSFIYTSPIVEFDEHIKSYKKLIEESDHQCERVERYIRDCDSDNIVFYDEHRNEKISIRNSTIKKVFKISVTVDNINSFAARAEKISFLELKSKAICLGLDDLITYSEYFTSPLQFIHYLRQREEATQTPNLELFDELDHLGMYITHNCYTRVLDTKSVDTHFFFDGYREELDTYFGQLYHPSLKPQKPEQRIPDTLEKILLCIEESDADNKCWLSSYFLDFDEDARLSLCDSIANVFSRQAESKKLLPIIYSGGKESLRFCLYLSQPGIEAMSEAEKEEHLQSIMLFNGEKCRVKIDIELDANGVITSATGREYYLDDINKDNAEVLFAKGKENASLRIQLYKQRHKKIGRNELCPCGSGKKYKKCCGMNIEL